jgi:hypothetical protein
MAQVLTSINPDRFTKIEELLNQVTFPVVSAKNRRGFPKHRAFVLLLVKHRCLRHVMTARLNSKYPELVEELLKLGEEICPFNFTSVYINKNVTSPPHKDTGNVGDSLIISLGQYIGSNLIIENIKYDARYTPIIFDGAKLEHWNTDDLIGTKYSLIFYKINNCT